ncbi:hypothetical protein GCM10027256_19100 [Novispirillum itersonii subsp. nipponicum]
MVGTGRDGPAEILCVRQLIIICNKAIGVAIFNFYSQPLCRKFVSAVIGTGASMAALHTARGQTGP